MTALDGRWAIVFLVLFGFISDITSQQYVDDRHGITFNVATYNLCMKKKRDITEDKRKISDAILVYPDERRLTLNCNQW